MESRTPGTSILLISILILICGIIVIRNAWVCDDAYIAFRTVDNFVHGHGLTWNTDERVQGFTNPLWVFLMSAFLLFTGELYYTSIFASLALTLLAVWITAFGVGKSASGSALAITILVFSKAFIDYSTSGLENPLSYLILAAFFYYYFERDVSYRTFFVLSLLAALGALNRMDTLLLYFPALLYVLVKLKTSRAVLIGVAGFIPFLVWELFSIVYYGFPFPNTYYAKLHCGVPLGERLQQGLLYYIDTLNLDPLTLIVIFSAISIVLITKSRKSLPLIIGISLYLLYIVRIGGDFMSGRYFAAPLFCSAMLISRSPLPSELPQAIIPFVIVLVLGLTSPRTPLLSDQSYGARGEAGINERGMADERGWYYQSTGLLRATRDKDMPAHEWVNDGRNIRVKGDSFVALSCIGFRGYFAGPDVHVYDGYGLTDPLLARLPLKNPRDWRIGHFSRTAPWKYVRSLEAGENLIEDPGLKVYYDKLLLITRGELFDPERWIAIWKMNTGGYDSLLEAYTCPPRLSVQYSDICAPKAAGTDWNADGNFIIRPSGIEVELDSIRHSRRFEISVDHNDYYTVVFYRDSTELGAQDTERRRCELGGLRIDTLDVPFDAHQPGYNRLLVLPVAGDDLYSIGHLRLLD
jgi:arabinofuranosyltransferase